MAITRENLADEILISLRRIIRAVDIYSRKFLKDVGLTTPQFIILRCIVDNPEISVSALARKVALSQATVTPIIERLIKVGFIIKQKNTTDRRKTVVLATASGKETIQNSPPPLQETFLDELYKLAEWERFALLASLQRVAHMMNAEEISAAPVLTDENIPTS